MKTLKSNMDKGRRGENKGKTLLWTILVMLFGLMGAVYTVVAENHKLRQKSPPKDAELEETLPSIALMDQELDLKRKAAVELRSNVVEVNSIQWNLADEKNQVTASKQKELASSRAKVEGYTILLNLKEMEKDLRKARKQARKKERKKRREEKRAKLQDYRDHWMSYILSPNGSHFSR